MIAAQGLTKFYGDTCAVQDLSFEIDKGEIVGMLGLNGAGKTTTLKILSCLLLPSSGKVTVNGRDVVESPHETRQMVGFLPDRPPLYDEMTVDAYLTFAGELRGMPRATIKKRLDEVLELIQATDVRDEIVGNLSHGFRQRVAIGQSVIHEPEVLILDEPISGLDPAQIKEMREMVRGLAGAHTILLSSHILSEISQTCDRILVIHDGKIVASGTEEELAKQGGAQQIKLSIRGDREAIIKQLKGLDDVLDCIALEQIGGGAPFRGEKRGLVFEYLVDTSADIREAMAKAIVEGGFGLLRMATAEAELESAFLQLTHKGPGIKASASEREASAATGDGAANATIDSPEETASEESTS